MDMNAFSRHQRIPQFEQGDIGVLRDQFFEKSLMGRKLAPSFRTSLGQWLGMPPRPDRA